jgi:hypothetical protein
MLFIVARDRPRLYESLRRQFAEEREVQVILDRRHGERPGGTPPREDAPTDRRRRPEVDQDLQVLGWAVVRGAPAKPADR